jgi:hypothetical protein
LQSHLSIFLLFLKLLQSYLESLCLYLHLLFSVLFKQILSFSNTICWKGCLFSNIYFLALCWKSDGSNYVDLFHKVYVCFLCQYHDVFVTMALSILWSQI